MASNAEIKDFVMHMYELCKVVQEEKKLSTVSVHTCIAQACIESGYGKSTVMKKAHAFFGIKANASWVKAAKYGGLVYNSATKECYDGKTYTNISGCFRAYNTDIDSIRDYFDLMSSVRYKKSMKAASVNDCITIIKEAGYATAPNYVQSVMSVYSSIQQYLNQDGVSSSTQNEKELEDVKENIFQDVNDISQMSQLSEEPVKEANKNESGATSKKVRVSTKRGLYIRAGAGKNYKIIGGLMNNAVVSIASTKSNWGKLADRSGWICLDFVKKV